LPVQNPPETLGSERRPLDASRLLTRRAVTGVAAILIVVQLLVMGSLLAHAYLRQDDYFTFDRALTGELSWGNLTALMAGHLSPLGFALSWLLAHASLYNWTLTASVVMVAVAAASVALLGALRTLFGDRPRILVPLAVYLFSPLALAAVDWWSVAVQALGLELSIFMALAAHVRYLRDGRTRQLVAAGCWLVVGMLAVEQGALVPLLLFALTTAFFVEGRWSRAVVTAARRYWRGWALYGALLTGYWLFYTTSMPSTPAQAGDPGLVGRVGGFLSPLLGTTLVPGALGGPWRWSVPGYGYAQPLPPVALQELSWVVGLLIVAASCLYRVRAWRAWAILLGWIAAADVLPVALGSSAAPALQGLQVRYAADGMAVAALCLGLAFLPLAGEEGGYRFEPPMAPEMRSTVKSGVTLLVAAFLAGSFWSLQALAQATSTTAARAYIATARQALAHAPSGSVIADSPTPAMIMDPVFFGPQASTSHVLGPLTSASQRQNLIWAALPSGVFPHLMVFDGRGRLRPAVLAGLSSGPAPARAAGHPTHGCWPLSPAGTTIPLPGNLYAWTWIVRLDHSGPADSLTVDMGGQPVTAILPAGSYSYYVPVVGSGNAVTIRMASGGSGRCLSGVTVGTWQPG
jgi:hypothetical protein